MKTFHPIQSIYIKASAPHPINTEYRVSIGNEFFDNVPENVIVVQMVYGGKVEGRKSPTYPAGTDDFLRVSQAVNELLESVLKRRNTDE